MQDDLETGGTEQGRGAPRTFHIMPAFVHLQDAVIQTLRAHLHLGNAQMTQPAQFVRCDLVGAGLDHQAHVTMHSSFIQRLRFSSDPHSPLL